MTQTAFARLAGVSKMAVSKAARAALKPALIGDRIDAEHPAARAYLANTGHGRKPRQGPPVEGADVEPYADLLEPLLKDFGTARGFKDWLDAVRKIQLIRSAKLENDEAEGRLIARELVRHHVFGHLDALSRRLLTDLPKTGAALIASAARAGKPLEEIEAQLRELISSQLKPARAAVTRSLRAGR